MSQRAPHDSMVPTLGGPSGPGRLLDVEHALQADGAEIPRRLGRFELASLLGEGGMGRVFAAYDPELRRDVAVKVLRAVNPATIRRFVREARTQASVFHPHVCPVLEAGTVDGQPYIVMPRIDGERLDTAAQDLPLERKLLLVRQVADGVHAAHQAGLIHRDLKPSNILVESTDDGLVPWVLDFGLARPQAEPRFTRTGDVVGTPAYMSPEQVRGDAGQLDRRTDVYSLGACLYALLAGKTPFGGSDPSVFSQILEQEPPPLRRLGIPADVEAVALKCLEKDPSLRYGSARELAEDLDRYLAGEPVLARPTGGWYRFGKWTRRNAPMVRLGAAALLILVAALAWSSWRSDRRETVIRSMTRQVEEIEALARYSGLSPLHDVRPDRELIRQRMAGITETMSRADSVGRAAGEYALGRGHLALGELEPARRHLESAWAMGLRDRDVASALARTLSGLYQQEFAELELVRDWESRQRRRDALERDYGDPARLYLDQSLSDLPSQGERDAYLLALSEFHHDRFEEAVAILRRADRLPWQQEIDLLEGEILRTWAVESAAADDLVAAREHLRSARAALGRAAEIAPSDPGTYQAAARVEFQELGLDVAGAEASLQLDRGLVEIERAVSVDPESGKAWLWKARLHRLAATRVEERSGDAQAVLMESMVAATRATKLLAVPSPAWRELGRIQWGLAQWQQDRALDPGEWLEAAAQSLDRVEPADQDYAYCIFRGMVERTRARHLGSRGDQEGANDGFRRAVEAYRAAVALHSEPFAALLNESGSLLEWAQEAPTDEWTGLVRQAIASLEVARSERPEHFAAYYYLGKAHLLSAQHGDPQADFLEEVEVLEAIASYEIAEDLAPKSFQVPSALGEAHHLRGVAAWEAGLDPGEHFAAARRAQERAVALAPEHPIPWINLAWTAYFEGKVLVRQGRAPSGLLKESMSYCRRILAGQEDRSARLCLASAHRIRAEYLARSGGDPLPDLDAAESGFREILVDDPELAEAHRSLGCLLTQRARWFQAAGRDPGALVAKARESLVKAVALNSGIARSWLSKAELHLLEAELGDPGAIAPGLESVDRSLELRPRWPKALAVRSALARTQVSGSMITSADRVPPP